VGCESSKRTSSSILLTLHASGDASRDRYSAPDEEVTTEMLRALVEMAGERFSAPSWTQLKRWRYARPTLLANARALLAEEPPIVFCGDWAVAPRVEGAFLSGLAAAERLIGAGYA